MIKELDSKSTQSQSEASSDQINLTKQPTNSDDISIFTAE